MATINLGAIKFNWKGAYAGGTAYTVDDVVSSGGSSYVCILASTGNAVSNATYWSIMSSAGTNGTNGTDVGTIITTQGDVLYRDGSGLQRLAKPASNKFLQNTSGGVPSWEDAGGGKVLQVLTATDETDRSTTSTTFIVGSNTLLVTITPSATTSKIYLNCTGFIYHNTSARYARATIFRDSTDLGAASNKGLTSAYDGSGDGGGGMSMSILDSPSSTSAIAYQVKFLNSGSGVANLNFQNTMGVLTAMEIGV